MKDTKKTRSPVLADAKKVLSDLVFNMSSHEGNPMTQPDVHSLIIDGITVGGYSVSDAEQVSNIAKAWREFFSMIEKGSFQMNKDTILQLHRIYAKNEALVWGEFRNRGVTISGTDYLPPHHSELDTLFNKMINTYLSAPNKDEASYELFLSCAQNQYFHDGNKRTEQFLMNGARLMNELAIITIPARRASEYNAKMVHFYNSGERKEMIMFLKECRVNAN